MSAGIRKSAKSADAFRTISEVSREIGVPQHVLRFWETKFGQVSPLKRGGGRRYYRPGDMRLLECIRDLLYVNGFTIKGVQKLIRERGVTAVVSAFNDGGLSGDSRAKKEMGEGKSTADASQRQAIVTAVTELVEIREILIPPTV